MQIHFRYEVDFFQGVYFLLIFFLYSWRLHMSCIYMIYETVFCVLVRLSVLVFLVKLSSFQPIILPRHMTCRLTYFKPVSHNQTYDFNSLTPGRCGNNFTGIIFKLVRQNSGLGTSYEISDTLWNMRWVTHCGLVMSYGNMDLGQHCLR